MKTYKVYAQNVRSLNPIVEIDGTQISEEIYKCADDYFDFCNTEYLEDDNGDISEDKFNAAWQAVASLLTKHFEKSRTLECGDYMIITTDEQPTRPNMCGMDINLLTVEEITEAMNGEV